MEHKYKEWYKIGCKKKNVKVNCIVFADDMALFTEKKEEAQEQIIDLKKEAAK